MNSALAKPIGIRIVAINCFAFGLLSITSGGSVLFIGGKFQEFVGNYVLFVVWFNFVFGFIYIAAGVGIWRQKQWAVWLSLLIVISTLVVLALLGIHIFRGGLYEIRTILAMIFRAVVWVLVAYFSYIKLIRSDK